VVDVVLGAVVANFLGQPGDSPLWLLLVNPAGSGKTELVQLFRDVPWCEWLAELTESTFLSGLKRPAGYGARGSEGDRKHSLSSGGLTWRCGRSAARARDAGAGPDRPHTVKREKRTLLRPVSLNLRWPLREEHRHGR
jgi:hypothetical protein